MQQYNVYAIGQPVLIEAFNTNAQGDPESPSSPQILLKPPTGPEESLAVTENPVGHIFHELRALTAGRFFYRIVTADDALERFFVVRASEFEEPLP